jgi:hypothetical protein
VVPVEWHHYELGTEWRKLVAGKSGCGCKRICSKIWCEKYSNAALS